jgi:putative hydrolase of the HAD superfamily
VSGPAPRSVEAQFAEEQSRAAEPARYPLRGLLLDFGAVISVSVFERHRESEALLGLPEGSLTWLGPLAPASDPLWQAMQREEISERQYWQERAREVGQRLGEVGWSMYTLLERTRQSEPDRVVRPAIDRLLREAKAAGLRTGILSNELELFYGAPFLGRLKVLQHVDVLIDATHTGILKPDPRSYQHAVQALGLAPDEILFVDDQFRNIAGAVRAGLQTQYFDLRDIAGNIAAIRARLNLPMP